MADLPRSRALVAFDPNGFLLPTQPVTPAGSRVWRFLHRMPVLVTIGLALFLVSIFASDLAGAALRSIGLGRRGLYAAPLVGSALVAASYWIFVRIVERRRSIDEFELPVAPQQVAAGFAGGVALSLAIVAVLVAAGDGRTIAVAPVGTVLPALAVAAAGAVVQEIVMRGEVFRLIERVAGSWIALAVSSGALGIVQLVKPEADLLGVAAAVVQNGVLFAAVFMLTRRLWAGIGVHIGWNAGSAMVTIVTGAAIGLRSSWPAIAVVAAICVVLLLLAVRRSRIVAPAWTRGRVTRRREAAEFG